MRDLQYLFSLFHAIPAIVILVGAIMLYNKSNTTPTILILISSIIHLFVQIVYSIIPFINSMFDVKMSSLGQYYSVVGIVGFINSLAFGIGLILLAQQYLQKN
jgi:hypothetical protein